MFPGKMEAQDFRRWLGSYWRTSYKAHSQVNEWKRDFTLLFGVTFWRLVNGLYTLISHSGQRRLTVLGLWGNTVLNGHLSASRHRRTKTRRNSLDTGSQATHGPETVLMALLTHLPSIRTPAQLSPRPTDSFLPVTVYEGDPPAPGHCYHRPHVPLAGCCAVLPFG